MARKILFSKNEKWESGGLTQLTSLFYRSCKDTLGFIAPMATLTDAWYTCQAFQLVQYMQASLGNYLSFCWRIIAISDVSGNLSLISTGWKLRNSLYQPRFIVFLGSSRIVTLNWPFPFQLFFLSICPYLQLIQYMSNNQYILYLQSNACFPDFLLMFENFKLLWSVRNFSVTRRTDHTALSWTARIETVVATIRLNTAATFWRCQLTVSFLVTISTCVGKFKYVNLSNNNN